MWRRKVRETDMPSFRWSAVDGGGDVVSGVMEAPDRAIVVEQLQRQGQIVLRADPADRRQGFSELLQIELAAACGIEVVVRADDR